MNFKQAYQEMLKGKKIKRPGWGGYWFIEDGKVKIRLKTGLIIENNFNPETIPNTVAEDWEVVGEKKWWEPKKDEKYYIICGDGSIDYNNYDGDGADKRLMDIGNCFQTENQTEFMLEKLKVIHELEKFAYENNDEEIDWNNKNQFKFSLVFGYNHQVVQVNTWSVIREIPFNVYFTSEELAKKAIETIGEDRIKKYYFGVNENGRE